MSYRYIGTIDYGTDLEEIRKRRDSELEYYSSLSPKDLELIEKREIIGIYIKEIEKMEVSIEYGLCIDVEYVKEAIREMEEEIRKIESSMY